MGIDVLIALVTFVAALTQRLTGFGSGLIPMSILPALVGIHTTTPLVALITTTVDLLMLSRYRAGIRPHAVYPLLVGMVFGIPLGILALRQIDERIVLGVLGAVISLYALYALVGFRIPRPNGRPWAWGVGFLAGMLGGAYNTSGPPLIVYGQALEWPPDEFKANLQTLFIFNDVTVIAGHLLAHNMTRVVTRAYLIALPALIVGFLVGGRLDRFLNPERFRVLVLVLLFILGLRLVLA
ncbi:MAG: sulfite exporter TauE/SafE family protein [Thermoflexales bacterium]|nr:sulfite exporter TauE/SafE family protein [Thermoflexales bacterium]